MFNFLKTVYLRGLVAIDGFVSRIFNASSKNQHGIAIVRLDAIGDFIIWLDTAKEYRRLYPNQKITLIANAAWADMAQCLPYWDEVWPVKLRDLTRRPLYRWALLRRIRQSNFETVIQPTFSRVLMHGDSLIRASGAKHRIGSVGDLSNISARDKALADHWYTRLIPASPRPMMELQRNAEFLSQLAGVDFQASLPRLPKLTTLPKQIRPEAPYFVIFPGASWSGRKWPMERFAEVIVYLHRELRWLPVLCGGKNESGLCESISSISGVYCMNLAGQTSLAELAEVIRGANLLIGNETSAVHIAAAVGTRSVCVLGGGHFGRFMPYPDDFQGIKPVAAFYPMSCFNCNWKCRQSYVHGQPVPCIARVTVSEVLSRCADVLALPQLFSPCTCSHTLRASQPQSSGQHENAFAGLATQGGAEGGAGNSVQRFSGKVRR